MKYVKYALGIIAILAIGFFLMGIIKPEISYECEVVVDKPIAESWAVVQDEEKLSEWLSGFEKIEPVSGTPGTVGAVSNVYFDADGEKMEIQETITGIVPNESISMTYTSDFMNMDYKLKMTPIDGGTKINSMTTTVGNGMLSKSIMALVGGSIKAQEETNLNNLKRTIEQNKKQYAPVADELSETGGEAY